MDKTTYDTPAQNALKIEITNMEKTLANLIEARNMDVGGESVVSLTHRIKELTTCRDDLKKSLKEGKLSKGPKKGKGKEKVCNGDSEKRLS